MEIYHDIHALRTALAALLSKRGITQQDVSKATGITQSAISMFIGEKRGLNGDSVLRLIRFLSDQTAPQEAQDG